MALRPIKGEPGKFLDTVSGEVLDISDYREDDKYDTIAMNAGPVAPNFQRLFFADELGAKTLLDTNIQQLRQLSQGEEMIVDRVGMAVANATGNILPTPSDIKKFVENAFVSFTVNRLVLIEGPVIKFPSGYGLHGNTVETGQGIVSIGTPSTAAASKLLKTQLLTSQHQFQGTLVFFDRQWPQLAAAIPAPQRMPTFDNPLTAKAWLHGLLKVASTKN
jgi:hypothetical protein